MTSSGLKGGMTLLIGREWRVTRSYAPLLAAGGTKLRCGPCSSGTSHSRYSPHPAQCSDGHTGQVSGNLIVGCAASLAVVGLGLNLASAFFYALAS